MQKYYSPFESTKEVGEMEYKALMEDFQTSGVNRPKLPTPVPEPETPVASTTPLREAEAGVKAQAAEGLKSLADFDAMSSGLVSSISKIQPYSLTTEGATAKTELEQLRKNLGITTAEEQERIRQAGITEGAKYDPLIEDAKASKKQGLAKSVVAGGERGGFMNTQIAGVAALAPTEGGNFIGSGGELNQIQGIYDRNISTIRAAKIAAVSQAEAAARQAIRTGKESDYKLFADAYDRAQQTSQQELALVNEKMTAISNFETMQKARINTALDELSTVTATGMEIPEDLAAVLDGNYGAGFTGKYKELLKAQQEAQSEEAVD
jgi:predicted outer membrane protein